MLEVVIPSLKARLAEICPETASNNTTFYYQWPPTLRIQPGPSTRYVRAHNDAEYGHQNGEVWRRARGFNIAHPCVQAHGTTNHTTHPPTYSHR